MKKMFASLLALSMVLVGCGGGDSNDESKKPEIVMLTDKGTIDDKSFNQGTYEGVKAYADENGIECTYIKPVDATTDEYKNSIDQAVRQGAKVVVCPGYLFEVAIYEKQTEYPDVKFILVDGVPNDGKDNPETKDKDENTYETGKNTISIKYSEEQSGYLAGYAAVKDGNTSLGFMGGQAVPAIMNFGYGYVQGANDAAKELGITVKMRYHYTGGFSATPEIQTKASSWYKDGVTVVFGCGGSVGNSVMAAAEASNPVGKVIGVDVDQSSESDTVVTSAYKKLGDAVQKALESIYSGDFDKTDDTNIQFRGGQNIVLGAKDGDVGLPLETSKFEKFTEADYNAIYDKIVDGSVKIKNNKDAESPKDLNCSNVELTIEN